MPSRRNSQVASHSGSRWQGQWEPYWDQSWSWWSPRNDADGEWKFVQKKRKGKSSRSPENSAEPLDKETVKAKESHRTFLEVVLNGQVGPNPAKNDADEVLKEVQAAQEELLQSQIAKARAAAVALGDDPAFAKQVTELQSEIVRLEKQLAGGKSTGKSSLAHRVEQKSLYVGRETKRLEQLRKDVETAQAVLIAREADLAEEKLLLQKLKDELVAGNSRDGGAMVVDSQVDDEAILQQRELELLRSFVRDASARGEGINVPVELAEVQRSLEERATKKQRCG